MEKYNIETEIWKDITEYEGYYQVSNLGRVRSLDREVDSYNQFGSHKLFYEGKILKPTLRSGYYRVILSKESKPSHRNIHRLVAETFIDNPDNLEQINHIDCNKLNNNLENLEWVSHLGNAQHAKENGRYKSGSSHNQSILNSEEIAEILYLYFKKELFQSEIANLLNINQTYVSKVTRGETWHFKENKHLVELRDSYL